MTFNQTEPARSFLVRYWIYQRERFPLFQTGLLIAAFTFSAASYSRICRGADGFIPWRFFLGGTFTAIALFLLLRLFDEFKDAEEDAKYRPYRAVPRGLVSLREIGWGIVIAILAMLAVNLLLMPVMLLALLPALGYQLLMWREFFIPKLLRRHPVAYLVTHMAVMPMIDFYTTGLDWLNAAGILPPGLPLFLLVTFLNGCVIEIGRKIRAPQDEEHGVETYSVLWGPRRAALVWLAILTVTGALGLACCRFAGYALPALPFLLFFWSVGAGFAIRFIHSGRGAKWLETASGLWTIAMYLTIGGVPMLMEWSSSLWN